MEKQNTKKERDELFWFEQPADIQQVQIFQSQQTSSNELQILEPFQKNIEQHAIYEQNQQMHQNWQVNQYLTDSNDDVNTQVSFQPGKQKCLKREYQDDESGKNQKKEKQHLYSKAYRQRKKEKYKLLEEQNNVLKKRIKDLQDQLREQQIQLNRFKFPAPEKQLTIEQLSKQLIDATIGIVKKAQSTPFPKNKIVCTPQDPQYHFLIESYDQRGFAGTKKMKLLNYYFNQMLEAMLKDSQKYLSLLFVKSPNWDQLVPLPEYDALHAAFYDVFDLNDDLSKRLKYFVKNLYPMAFQYNRYCSEFYKSFQNIVASSQKIHNFLRETYLSNMDVTTKRLQLQRWFQFNKYGRILRRLRNQWLEMIKSGTQLNLSEIKKNTKGTKKKKVEKQQV